MNVLLVRIRTRLALVVSFSMDNLDSFHACTRPLFRQRIIFAREDLIVLSNRNETYRKVKAYLVGIVEPTPNFSLAILNDSCPIIGT